MVERLNGYNVGSPHYVDKYVDNQRISFVEMLKSLRVNSQFHKGRELIHVIFHMAEKTNIVNTADDFRLNPLIHDY